MNTLERASTQECDTIIETPPSSPWVTDFLGQLGTRMHGEKLSRLIEPKSNVRQTVIDFAGDMLPDEAIEIAEIAHLAELVYHENLGKNIQRSLGDALYMNYGLTEEQSRYTGALISDLATLSAHAKEAHKTDDKSSSLKLLAERIASVNIESVILKAALDYSNFMLLEGRSELSGQEAQKMERVISSVRHIDSVLLETLGFDALSAEILDKVFRYELKQIGAEHFVTELQQDFDQLGGRQAAAATTQHFLHQLFQEGESIHYQVTDNQTDYDMYFTDGEIQLPGSGESFRTLSRLKSIGAAAKKTYEVVKKAIENGDAMDIADAIPADLAGITFIAKDVAGIKIILQHVMQQLDQMDTEFVSPPSRIEQIHIKGQLETFVNQFSGTDSPLLDTLSVKREDCDNGYESVKLTIRYNNLPIEMQFTHEASRVASRSGPGSHTIFKLLKLFGIDIRSSFTTEDLAALLSEINSRTRELSKDNLTIVPGSKARAEALERSVAREVMLATHYSAADRLGTLASQKCALVV